MFMRLLQLQLNPDFTKEFKQFYQETVSPKLQEIDGCLFASLIKGKPEEDEYISLTFWKTQQQAENYERSELFQELLDEAKPFFSESNEWKFQLSEDMEIQYKPETDAPTIKKYSVAVQKEGEDNVNIRNENIYVRIVALKIQDGKLDEFKKIYSEVIIPAFKETKGCIQAFLTQSVSEEDDFLSMTIWESKAYAEEYESSGTYKLLLDKVKHTFSQFYLWKMSLDKQQGKSIQTSDDLHIEQYEVVTGKSFI